MVKINYLLLTLLALFCLSLSLASPSNPLAQEKTIPRGTLKVVDLGWVGNSLHYNSLEGLVTLDKDNSFVPCLAEGWKWIDERTIEFRLRQRVTFQNGEKFDAEAVRVNWEAYKAMKAPWTMPYFNLPDKTVFETVDDYTVRFALPEPDGLAFVKFKRFVQVSPAFLQGHKFSEEWWGYLTEPGPWGTGPFKLVEGGYLGGKLSDRVVLEAYENYWDPRYPRVKTLIFDNTLLKDREKAMRLCRETEGVVDIVSFIRPLDTLKVAKSPFAKLVKSRDSVHMHAGFNQRKKDSKWRDIRLRKALNYAINREELWQYCAKGNAYNLGGHIPPGARGHNPNLTLYTYDTTKARALLAEAGYPNGFEMTLITPEGHKLEAQIMKRMIERIGLKVKLEVYSYYEWLQRTWGPLMDKPHEEQEWDLGIAYIPDSDGHPAVTHLVYPCLESSGARWCEYDPIYEKMWKDIARTVDQAEQDEKMRQMEKYLYDRAYMIFIYSPLTLYAVNKEVNFVPQRCMYVRLKETSVTDNHWSVRSQD